MHKEICIENENGSLEGFVSDNFCRGEEWYNWLEDKNVPPDLPIFKNVTKFAILSSLFVKDDKRNMGCGSRLVLNFIKQAIEENCDIILLEADKNSDLPYSLKEFYEGFGFELIQEDFWIMGLFLTIVNE